MHSVDSGLSQLFSPVSHSLMSSLHVSPSKRWWGSMTEQSHSHSLGLPCALKRSDVGSTE